MTGKREKVAVYARVSGEEQREAGTIENQLDFARRYCELHVIEIADTYRDDGVTGTVPLDQRPEGRRLLRDAADGKFDAVLVYRVDRLARKTIHLLNAYEQLDTLGIGLRSMTESFDTVTPAGKFTMTMFASIAALERDTILERTALGKQRKRQQGKWVEGGKPPFGYRVSDEGYLEIEPEEAAIVRTIFRLYTEEGMTTTGIADYLTAREVPVAARLRGTHKGNRGIWRPGRVSTILANATYMGHFCPFGQHGRESTLEVPAVIPEETWRKGEAMRDRNKAGALRNSKRRYLLRGLIRCGHCGLAYVGNSPGGRKYTYYSCMGGRNVNRTLDERCNSANVRADKLEELVWQDIEGFIRDPGPVILQLEARLKSELAESRPVEDELAEVDAEIARKREDRQRVINLYRRGLIDDSDVERELAGVEREVATLNDRRTKLLAQAHTIQDLKTQTTTARLLLEQLRDKLTDITWEAKRELVEALVESITVETVLEDGKRTPKVTIRYRFGGENSQGGGPGGGKRISDCSSAPLGPSRPKISPRRMSKETLSTAACPLNCLCRLLTRTKTSLAPVSADGRLAVSAVTGSDPLTAPLHSSWQN